MSNDDDTQKTEEPTPKKLHDARQKGQVPLSRELNHWVMILAATILVASMADTVFVELRDFLKIYIQQAHDMPQGESGIYKIMNEGFAQMFYAITSVLVVLMIAAFAGPFLQVGPLFSAESLTPKWEKISLIKGFGRLFSLRTVVEFVKGLLKITIVGLVGSVILYPYFDKFEVLIGMSMLQMLDEMLFLIMQMMAGIMVVLVVVAFIDVVYQRYDHHKKLMMSRQEIKDEQKQTEGDPQVRARLRQLRMEKSRQRMMQAVPEADVVITNPTHYAIALKYESGEMEAPLCVAKGADEIALKIREVAKEHGVEIYENKPLARSLYDAIEIDQMIPYEHFHAVAEVISYVFKAKGKLKK